MQRHVGSLVTKHIQPPDSEVGKEEEEEEEEAVRQSVSIMSVQTYISYIYIFELWLKVCSIGRSDLDL